jgi:hypothetical protein
MLPAVDCEIQYGSYVPANTGPNAVLPLEATAGTGFRRGWRKIVLNLQEKDSSSVGVRQRPCKPA